VPKSRATVLYLTGKGGVGKTFLAERLAAHLGALTGRVGLVSMPRSVGLRADTQTAASPEIETIVLDDRVALGRLLERVVGLRFFSDRLLDSRTFTAVAAAAPGVREFVSMSFIEEIAARERYRWLVVDGPATGHTLALLAAPARFTKLAPLGPASTLARRAAELVADPRRFVVALVATPEDLAAREAIDAVTKLRGLGLVPRGVVVNGVYPELTTAQDASWLLEQSANADVRLYLTRRRSQLEVVQQLARDVGPLELVPREIAGTDAAESAIDDLARRLVREAEA
jgi:anion-transporting  ArsA/GET3 family ATPase